MFLKHSYAIFFSIAVNIQRDTHQPFRRSVNVYPQVASLILFVSTCTKTWEKSPARSQGYEKCRGEKSSVLRWFVLSRYESDTRDNFCYVGLVDQLFPTTNMMLTSTSRRVAGSTNRRCRNF